MRAQALAERLDGNRLRALAGAWKVQPDATTLAAAMRGSDAANVLARSFGSAVMREDAVLLCANPFDAVGADELVEPQAFADIGLLVLGDDGSYVVNVDLALTVVPQMPIEFGFAATLLARLSAEERALAARSMRVGPRPSVVDTVLDVAAETATAETVMGHVARLKDSERSVIREALALGDLPDALDTLDLTAKPPKVTLDEGPAGQRGLVFRVTYPAAKLKRRPVVPLELVELLPNVLDQVPPPPETIAAKPRKRPSASTSRRRSRSAKTVSHSDSSAVAPTTGEASVVRRSSDPRERSGSASATADLTSSGSVGSWSGSLSALRDTATASGPNSPFRLGRVTSIVPASAIIDVETGKVADAVMADPVLSGDVLEVAAESLIVLRPDADARAWAERCAVRLGL